MESDIVMDGKNNNNSLIVFGINGTSAERYHVDQLQWKFCYLYGSLPTSCAVQAGVNPKCNGQYQVAAHVGLDDSRRTDGEWYLVPQCKSCNNHTRNGIRMALRKNAKYIAL